MGGGVERPLFKAETPLESQYSPAEQFFDPKTKRAIKPACEALARGVILVKRDICGVKVEKFERDKTIKTNRNENPCGKPLKPACFCLYRK